MKKYNGIISRIKSYAKKAAVIAPLVFLSYCGTQNDCEKKDCPSPGLQNTAPVFDTMPLIEINRGSQAVVDLLQYLSDKEGDKIYCSVGESQNFIATIDDCVATILPKDGYLGIDNVEFVATDSKGASSSYKAAVSSYFTNTAPVISAIPDVQIPRDTPISINLNDYITDPEGDSFICGITDPVNFDVVMDDCMLTITPLPKYVGTEEVKIEVKDEYGAGSYDYFNITTFFTNHNPVFSGPDSLSTHKNIAVSVNLNDYLSDEDGDALTCTAAPNSNLEIAINNCNVTITPKPEYYGGEVVSFTATDVNGGSASKNVNLSIDNPYGCESIYSKAVQQPDGSYSARVDMRFYYHPTGFILNPGKLVEIKTNGIGCWSGGLCNGPDEVPWQTWGIYYALKSTSTGQVSGASYAGSTIRLQNGNPTESYELLMVIPDGSYRYSCTSEYYKDNSGFFTTTITPLN